MAALLASVLELLASVSDGSRRLLSNPIAVWTMPLQGQGLGSTLLQPLLRKADAAGLGCYLETDKDIDVVFYRKHSFEVVVEGLLPRGGPPFWTMKRPPRA